MLAELAQFALIMALVLSLTQVALVSKNTAPAAIANISLVSFFLILGAFVALVMLRLDSDFSVSNVAEHSNLTLPTLYKITGTWGNHEGSMLLWQLVLSGFAAVLAVSRSNTQPLVMKTLVVQALLLCGALIFTLVTSNPFARVFPPAQDGAMLNPLLQDIALALHPPMLYSGYVGFSIVFSFAVAGLWQREIGREWAEMVHPWIVCSWSALTVGIGLGSWWAYRELGWGGYWFWDPVENASLLPWLAGTALLHSNIVLKKRGLLSGWVVLLAIITFGLSMLGTFLVRSGLLTSVHSFASDPERGLYILLYMAIAIGSALTLYAVRIKSLTQAAPVRPASREGMIVINNLFLLTACATVLIGTLYPMISEWLLNRTITVGSPYYVRTFIPLMVLPLIFAGLAPFMPWKKAGFFEAVGNNWPAFTVTGTSFILVFAYVQTQILFSACGIALAAYLLTSSGNWLLQGKWKNASHWSVFLGHAGAACLILGLTGAGLWAQQAEKYIGIGERMAFAGYVLDYFDEDDIETPNYTGNRAHILIFKNGKQVAELAPEYRNYTMRKTSTSETSIYSTPAYDLYAVIGESSADGTKTALRVYYKPTVSFLWFGCLVMASGGLCSLFAGLRRRRKTT